MKYIDLNAQYECLKQEIDQNIQKVINNANFISGDEVKTFEEELADFVGVKHVISCSDGTAALQLIYMVHNIGYGDAVFCPDMTFIASVEPACLLGATPVFCEIDKDTYNIAPLSLERQINRVIDEGKLTPRAVIAVDFLGNPADYDLLKRITSRYKLLLIEDAAQGIGASYQGRKCGSLGDIAATSFFPSKPLGCYGDGGAIFTNDDYTDMYLRSLRAHGKGKSKYDNINIGINSRLDNLQAAILLPKLHILQKEIEKRQRIADYYCSELKEYIKIPYVLKDNISAYAQFVVQAVSKEAREKLQQSLKAKDIPTIRYYPTPMHRMPVFQGINSYGECFSNADQYAECSFGIPFSPYISESDQNKVMTEIKTIIKKI